MNETVYVALLLKLSAIMAFSGSLAKPHCPVLVIKLGMPTHLNGLNNYKPCHILSQLGAVDI